MSTHVNVFDRVTIFDLPYPISMNNSRISNDVPTSHFLRWLFDHDFKKKGEKKQQHKTLLHHQFPQPIPEFDWACMIWLFCAVFCCSALIMLAPIALRLRLVCAKFASRCARACRACRTRPASLRRASVARGSCETDWRSKAVLSTKNCQCISYRSTSCSANRRRKSWLCAQESRGG